MREINYQALYIGLCVIGVLVVVINAALFVGYRKNQGQKGLPLDQFPKRAQQPWEQEERSIQELARRVNELKEKRGNNPSDPSEPEDPVH